MDLADPSCAVLLSEFSCFIPGENPDVVGVQERDREEIGLQIMREEPADAERPGASRWARAPLGLYLDRQCLVAGGEIGDEINPAVGSEAR
ncbi:hypothetical protein PlfCFBP13513_17925 [Plantibacter flavus]|nr:hypothetical protein PlfCFBP13513_17925 [Plantibacter flavus]